MRDLLSSAHRRLAACFGGLALGLSVVACGGGDSLIAGVGSGGTGSFASGPISGFASVIVNGIRYDVSQARISNSEGAAASSSDLKLGMMVDVEGSALVTGNGLPQADAKVLHFRSEILGPIEARADGSLTVLGQTVRITSTTVFDAAAPLASLEAGQVVEIYGLAPGAQGGAYIATRVERSETADRFRLAGSITALDRAAPSLRIGDALISLEAFASSPVLAGLEVGQPVRVRLLTQRRASDGAWVADRIQGIERTIPDADAAQVEGLVTAFESSTRFSVDGIPVDASAAVFEGDASRLALGTRVEVDGAIRDGVLVASAIEIEDEAGASTAPGGGQGGSPGTPVSESPIFLAGPVESYDAASSSFIVHGLRVRFDGSTAFDDGDAGGIADGVYLSIVGRLDSDGSTVLATEIEFD